MLPSEPAQEPHAVQAGATLAFPGLVSLPECSSKKFSQGFCSVSVLCCPVPTAHTHHCFWLALGTDQVLQAQEAAASSCLTLHTPACTSTERMQ